MFLISIAKVKPLWGVYEVGFAHVDFTVASEALVHEGHNLVLSGLVYEVPETLQLLSEC